MYTAPHQFEPLPDKAHVPAGHPADQALRQDFSGKRNPLVIKSVKQQTNSDCGLACLAVVSGLALEELHEKFADLGKYGKHGTKRPWSTNNQDLIELAGCFGLTLSRFRFAVWNELPPMSIIKVNRGANRNFHWVACDWSDMYGPKSLLIHDPAYGEYCPFTLTEQMGIDIATLYIPFGTGLKVTNSEVRHGSLR